MSAERSGKSHATAWTLATIVLALLIYVASPGPLMYLQIRGIAPSSPPDWVFEFYRPYGRVQGTHLLDGWESWWTNLAEKSEIDRREAALQKAMAKGRKG